MASIELTLNILILGLIVLASAVIGYFLRWGQMAKVKQKIESLEREILENYAQILQLEKENTGMESKLQDIQSPVIPMKPTLKEEATDIDKIPDVSLRKKLLSRENLLKQQSVAK